MSSDLKRQVKQFVDDADENIFAFELKSLICHFLDLHFSLSNLPL